MATLVFRTPSGPLQLTQIGPADVIATLSAAHAMYGWLGGLDSIRFLLSKIQNKMTQKVHKLHLDSAICLLPTSAHMLTSGGPFQFTIDNEREGFGGDIRTQLVGLTLNALAYELDETTAVRLFMEQLCPFIVEGPNELLDALQCQLSDDATIRRILNEGASRGITRIFQDTAVALDLPHGDLKWLKANFYNNDDMEALPTEVHMVGGLLRWIGQDNKSQYFTRSALVARVAAYLKAVGYSIGTIRKWDGSGDEPTDLGPNAVVLVLGGSFPTDPLMLDEVEISENAPLMHYTKRTVGNLLLNALGYQTEIFPEQLQNDFDIIHEFVSSHLEVQWQLAATSAAESIVANFEWRDTETAGPIERSLAAIYFPICAEFVAPCYRRIATEGILRKVRDLGRRRASARFDTLEAEIARFRAVTAAICISIASRLDAESFMSTRHAASITLEDESWLEDFCKITDNAGSGSISLSEAVRTLASIHAGHFPTMTTRTEAGKLIGWRSGIYSILPTLLLKMQPAASAIGLTCGDVFYANVRVYDDGQIRDSATTSIFSDELNVEYPESTDQSVLARLSDPWLGPPVRGPPDCELYLNIERPLHYGKPDICFAARINGSVIGTVSIIDVLRTIILSEDEPIACSHTQAQVVTNVKASHWVKDRRIKPVGTEKHPAYIAVRGDAAWTLFLAGQSTYHNGRISHRCVNCAMEMARLRQPMSTAVLIGYG